jgi:hypothetical protein
MLAMFPARVKAKESDWASRTNRLGKLAYPDTRQGAGSGTEE